MTMKERPTPETSAYSSNSPNIMTLHRIVIQVIDSKHNKAAIDRLMPQLPDLLGPIHGPFEIIKREKVEIIETAML